jgi:TRAP transporter 4TM/12TM fusion protein
MFTLSDLPSLSRLNEIVRKNPRDSYLWVIGVVWALVQLYAGFFYMNIFKLTIIHVLSAISVTFAMNPTSTNRLPKQAAGAIDAVFTILPLVVMAYLLSIHHRLMTRISMVGTVTSLDILMGTIAVLLLLEAARRIVGLSLPIIGAVVIAYGFLGPVLPELIEHSGLTYTSMIDLLVLTDDAVFGVPAKISAQYVYLFVLFGAVLLESGAGDLFLRLAKSVGGSFTGGSAKIAVVASALMATINGSAVANTVSTGSITIPLMQRSGYSDEEAGAIEALASTGGQYMPPVMGAAAFILAEISGVPYFEVIIYAAIPATLYYIGVFGSVHFAAAKGDIGRIPAEELPSLRKTLGESAHLAVPILGMLFILFRTRNVELAAAVTVGLTMIVTALRSSTRMGPVGYLRSLKRGSEMVVSAAIPTAIAGIIIGVVFYSGVANRIASIIISLAGSALLPTLLIVALVSIVLGMGMPTSGAYVTVAILAVPALIGIGLPKISAHLFGLYFSVISMVTPPIALAAFAATGISGGDTWWTGIRAFVFGLPAYAIPFLFVLHPALLTKGTPLAIIGWFIVASLICLLLSVAGTGYLVTDLHIVERLLLTVGAGLLVLFPAMWWVGVTLLIVGLFRQARVFFIQYSSQVPSSTTK